MAKMGSFSHIHMEGTLLTKDFVNSILDKKATLPGLREDDYWLPPKTRKQDEINKAWDVAMKCWQAFRVFRDQQTSGDATVTATREKWLLPLFQQFQFGRLPFVRSLEADGEPYAISHAYEATPIHMIGYNQTIDARVETRTGTRKMSAHSLVQDYLNRHEGVRWGIVTNGMKLRILRDNASLARMSYIEFSLEDIMNDGAYREFSVMWLLLHASRLQQREVDGVRANWLDEWMEEAQNQGLRMRNNLCTAAQDAVEALGTGFLQHRENRSLQTSLAEGSLLPDAFKQQLLRIVYRLIFIFVAEDRDLLLMPDSTASNAGRTAYWKYYATTDLRKRSRRQRVDHHVDLWERIRLVMGYLRTGCVELSIPLLGSALWDQESVGDIINLRIENTWIIKVLHHLCWTRESEETLMAVDWRNMGSEELGSVYEVLLERVADVSLETGTLSLVSAQGNQRKTTGSYYTRTDLISCLLDSALEPVLRKASSKRAPLEAEKALLELKICDPACGSGHFLVAAAHRMARTLSRIRSGDVEATPAVYRHAIRDVVSHCIYGVDINPMSVELTKIALWLESMEPGKPLSFLDHHVKCGNSLFGTTPRLLAHGIPDKAYTALAGDDKKTAQEWKKRNKEERKSKNQMDLFGVPYAAENIMDYIHVMETVEAWKTIQEESIHEINKLEDRWHDYLNSHYYTWQKALADTWCAAFVQEVRPGNSAITTQVLIQMERVPTLRPSDFNVNVETYAKQYQFFHWHLEFPEVFHISLKKASEPEKHFGWTGGFNVVLGNPPWDKIKLQEVEWFSKRSPRIAKARTQAERKEMISALEKSDKWLFDLLHQERRAIEGNGRFAHDSGMFPRSSEGDVNTYMLFSELNETILNESGRAGYIVPSGIATDKSTAAFFRHLVEAGKLVSLFSFDNRKGLFPDVHKQFRFALMTVAGGVPRVENARFAFSLEQVEDLDDQERFFTLSKEEFERFNPNTGNCPTFRNAKEKLIAEKLYQFPVLMREERDGRSAKNPWGLTYRTLFHMTNDSSLFHTKEMLEQDGWKLIGNRYRLGEKWMVPLYEGKMFNLFDNRFATYENATEANLNSGQLPQLSDDEHQDPWKLLLPDFWVTEEDLRERIGEDIHSILALRDIARATDQRTGIFCMMPNVGCGNEAPLLTACSVETEKMLHLLSAVMSTFAFDWSTRLSVGGAHLNLYILRQLPIPDSAAFRMPMMNTKQTWSSFIQPLAIELYYTSWDMYSWSKSIGNNQSPYIWDSERRYYLQCVLNAATFHLYRIHAHDEISYMMDSFFGIKNDETRQNGKYMTKETILEIHEWLSHATGNISADDILAHFDYPCHHAPRNHPELTNEELVTRIPWLK